MYTQRAPGDQKGQHRKLPIVPKRCERPKDVEKRVRSDLLAWGGARRKKGALAGVWANQGGLTSGGGKRHGSQRREEGSSFGNLCRKCSGGQSHGIAVKGREKGARPCQSSPSTANKKLWISAHGECCRKWWLTKGGHRTGVQEVSRGRAGSPG